MIAFLNHLEDAVRQNLQDVKLKVHAMRKLSSLQNDHGLKTLMLFVYGMMRLPFVLLYYIYILPPQFLARKVAQYLTLVTKIVCRRSSHARHITEHIYALWRICDSILKKIERSKFTELIAFCVTTILEIIYTVMWPFSSPSEDLVDELSELLFYEESEYEDNDYDPYRHSIRSMHHVVPANPFKATIRIRPRGTDWASSESEGCMYSLTGLDVDSPASFPPTPFSRAHVMNRSSERVVGVMFAARDRLRLEAQSVSRDEYSRMIATEARTSGQFAVFDPRQMSSGVALTCGNHCAIKVGKGQCCCCRAMTPVRSNHFVYFEFSITVSSAQTPTLGIGLSPPDCPLNVMVGSWPRSVGLYTDGLMLTGSRWFRSQSARQIEAGSTVGMLVYIPSEGEGARRAGAEVGVPVAEQLVSGKTQSLFSSILSRFSGSSGDLTERGSSEKRKGEKWAGVDAEVMDEGGLSKAQEGGGGAPELSVEVPVEVVADVGADANRQNQSQLHSLSQQSQAQSPSRSQSHAQSPSQTHSKSQSQLFFQYAVNGVPFPHDPEAIEAMGEVVRLSTPLYPTVSLFSEDTRVWCRFCEADVVYRSRGAIGAPKGVRVYCLDGSLLLEETD